MAHAAGNINTATLRRFPVVTESCAVYHRPQAAKRQLQPELGDLTNEPLAKSVFGRVFA